jgi:hypothetical protein
MLSVPVAQPDVAKGFLQSRSILFILSFPSPSGVKSHSKCGLTAFLYLTGLDNQSFQIQITLKITV